MLDYPATRRTLDLEECAGVTFPDPYRWLEEESEEVRAWQRAQAQLASDYVRSWPHFKTLRRSVAQFHTGLPVIPRFAAGRWFRLERAQEEASSRVVVADAMGAAGRVLFEPRSENSKSAAVVSWFSPSPSGCILALGVCADGSERNTIRLVDVATGQLLPEAPKHVLMDSWLGGVQWLPDSSGFYYTALAGSPSQFRQAVYFHSLGGVPPAAALPIPIPSESHDYRGVMVSRCGCWAVAHHRILTPTPVAICDVRDPNRRWRPFITDVKHSVAGHVLDDAYVAITTLNAPRGRVVAVALDNPTPNDPATWRELIPESRAVMRNLTPIGEYLYVTELLETYARIRVFDRNGMLLGTLPLPEKGAVAELPFALLNLFSTAPSERFIFAFSSLIESWGIYSHTPGADGLEQLVAPAIRLDNAIVEDEWAISSDGTRVPYHTVRRIDVDRGRPQPTLLNGYGFGGVPWSPQFPGAIAAFIAAGGTFVHGHLRGGGEMGLDWWRAGSLKNRQNSYADVYAIATDLVTKGITSPRLLGVVGGSAGGLMAGVSLTQRPDLWRVAIPRVPVLDLIGGCRMPYLRSSCKLEFGDPEDPEEVRRIAGFSPYHLIKEGLEYPAVYIDAGDTDSRCPPWQARKFAARLQAAQAGANPILLHVWENTGHGWATAREIQIEEVTEWLAFVMQQLDMTPEGCSGEHQPDTPEAPYRGVGG